MRAHQQIHLAVGAAGQDLLLLGWRTKAAQGFDAHGKIAEFYAEGDIFVNLSDTGSIDKAILEAMASGLLVLTSNEAFKPILSGKYLTENDPEQIAEKIIALSKSEKDENLREYVAKNHSLENLIKKIIKELNE